MPAKTLKHFSFEKFRKILQVVGSLYVQYFTYLATQCPAVTTWNRLTRVPPHRLDPIRMYAWESRTFSLFKTRHERLEMIRLRFVNAQKSDLPWKTAKACVVASDDSSLRGLLRGGNPAACNYEDVDSPL